jgi:hypothetical protein
MLNMLIRASLVREDKARHWGRSVIFYVTAALLITPPHRPHNDDKAQWAQGGRPIWSDIYVYTCMCIVTFKNSKMVLPINILVNAIFSQFQTKIVLIFFFFTSLEYYY